MQKRIVSIEDEAEISELLSVVLDSPGIDLIQAYTGYDGLDAIRAQQPDLIILDIMLPDINGWEVYEALHADPATRDIPTVVLTVLRREFVYPRPQLIGPLDVYMTKPFDALQLRQQIEAILGLPLWT